MDNKKCIVIFLTEDTARTYDGKPLMLQDALFCPVLNWCMRAWMKKGVMRFFVVCDGAYSEEVLACVPQGAAALVGSEEDYRRDIGEFAAGRWVEEIREAMMPVGSMMLSFHTVPELIRLQQAVKEDINPRDSWRAARDFRLHIAVESAKRAFIESVKLAGGDL